VRGPGSPINTLYFGSNRVWRSADGGTTMPAVSQVLVAGQPIVTIAVAPRTTTSASRARATAASS
jgi:hypothetical protein